MNYHAWPSHLVLALTEFIVYKRLLLKKHRNKYAPTNRDERSQEKGCLVRSQGRPLGSLRLGVATELRLVWIDQLA
jgi:hypothetical protein